MRTFTNEKKITSVKRLSYSGGKGTQSVVGSNLTGYLRPLSEELAAVNGLQWGQAFNLITELGVDIAVADVITIDSVDYAVRGLAVHDRGRNTTYNKYLLVKGQK